MSVCCSKVFSYNSTHSKTCYGNICSPNFILNFNTRNFIPEMLLESTPINTYFFQLKPVEIIIFWSESMLPPQVIAELNSKFILKTIKIFYFNK